MEKTINQQLYRTNMVSGDYMRNTVKSVIDDVANMVLTTYGPFGSHGIIQNNVGCEPTKDGLKLISSMKFDHNMAKTIHENIVAISAKQVMEVGDGSTSTVLLLKYLYNAFIKLQQEENIPPTKLKNSVRKMVDMLKKELKKTAKQITTDKELYDIAYTSADGDEELAKIITDTLKPMASKEPMILLENSDTDSYQILRTKGLEIDGTVIRPDIFFNGYSRMNYNDPIILVINGRADMDMQMLFSLVQGTRKDGRDVIFLCSGIGETILTNCVTLHQTNPDLFNRVAFFQMKHSSHNDEFMDICAILGATPIDEETLKRVKDTKEMSNIISKCTGKANKALLSEFSAKFSEPKSNKDEVDLRISDINDKIAGLQKDNRYCNDRISDLKHRKALLSNNFAKILIGGVSSERKAINYELANDALPQVLSARVNGYVEGCNVAIPNIIYKLNKKEFCELDTKILHIIYDGYINLFASIVYNKVNDINIANKIVHEHISKYGFTALNLRDNDEHKVINSAETDRVILENATDMAVLLATAKSFLTLQPEFDPIQIER